MTKADVSVINHSLEANQYCIISLSRSKHYHSHVLLQAFNHKGLPGGHKSFWTRWQRVPNGIKSSETRWIVLSLKGTTISSQCQHFYCLVLQHASPCLTSFIITKLHTQKNTIKNTIKLSNYNLASAVIQAAAPEPCLSIACCLHRTCVHTPSHSGTRQPISPHFSMSDSWIILWSSSSSCRLRISAASCLAASW